MQSESAKLEITQPRLFTAGAVAVVNAYGMLLATPIFLSIIAVSVIKLGILTVLIPLLALAATAYFLPFGLGNTHITRLVRSLNPDAGRNEDGFIVQLTLLPRLAIDEPRVAQAETEREKRLFLHVAIGAALHGVVLEGGQVARRLRERDRQLSRRRGVAEEDVGHGVAPFLAGIPRH